MLGCPTMERSRYEPVENNAISPLGANNFPPDAGKGNLSMRRKGTWAPEVNCNYCVFHYLCCRILTFFDVPTFLLP